MKYRICLVGLGLMGASLAYALRGFRDAELVGVDIDPEVVAKAIGQKAVDLANTDIRPMAEGADLIIFCVYPRHIPDLLRQCADSLKPGAVLTDICGVKTGLYEELTTLLPDHVDYVGIHPMAGKERDGFDNGDAAIFRDTGFIICPLPSTKPESVELMREFAGYIGAAKLAVTDHKRHDEIIAYTSGLMHIASAGLCVDYHPDISGAFTAGAFRDCTRIANINADAWTELLLANGPNLVDTLNRYIQSLAAMRDALAEKDTTNLHALLERAGKNKREMLNR